MPEEPKENMWIAIGKYGFATVAAVALGLVLYQVVIVPFQTAQEESRKEAAEERAAARAERAANAKALSESAKEVSSSNKILADSTKQFADSYQKMATASDATVKILQELRDDQRKFPAVREYTKEGP